MWRDDEYVVHVAEPAAGLAGGRLLAMTGQRQTHRHTVGFIVELAVKAEKVSG
jgi:hypothetical protein